MSETILIEGDEPTWRKNIRSLWFIIPASVAALLLIGSVVFVALYMRANSAATEAGQTISSLEGNLGQALSNANTFATTAAENQSAAQNWQTTAQTALAGQDIAWQEFDRAQGNAQRAQETAQANIDLVNATAASLQADRDNALQDDRFVLPLDTPMVTELDTLTTIQPTSVTRFVFDTVYFVTEDGQTLVGIVTDNGRVFVDNAVVRRTAEELAAMNQIIQPKGLIKEYEYTDEIYLNGVDEPVTDVMIGTSTHMLGADNYLEVTAELAPMDGYTMVRLIAFSGHTVNEQLFPVATWILTGENVPANTAITPTAAPVAVTSVPATGSQPAAQKLRPQSVNYNDDKNAQCVSVRITGINPTGWRMIVDGETNGQNQLIIGTFSGNRNGGDARMCGVPHDHPFNIYIEYSAGGARVPGGYFPSANGAIHTIVWR
jgi:hypothetical protein